MIPTANQPEASRARSDMANGSASAPVSGAAFDVWWGCMNRCPNPTSCAVALRAFMEGARIIDGTTMHQPHTDGECDV